MRALFEPRASYIASLVPDPSRASIIDVGCGNGFLTYWLEQHFRRVVGVDYSQTMLDANPCAEKVCASATALPFGDDEFDLAVESHLLHHLEPTDRLTAIRELARVAKHGIVLYEPNRNNPLMFAFGLLVREERMSLAFSAGYMREVLGTLGWSCVDVRAEGLIVPNKAPASWAPLARRLERTPLRRLGFYTRAVALKHRGGCA